MSKKKNTLQDLDDFLKQQAAALVTPETLVDTPAVKTVEDVAKSQPQQVFQELNPSGPTNDPLFRKKLYDFIIESLQTQRDSLPEDKILINTALYLKNGSDWKNAIRKYWSER
ncbi:MAG TPA: hypothetical protein VFZ52_19400 [Chryseolinea sp.]